MNKQKSEELRKAIEQVIGHKLDTFLVLGYGEDGENGVNLSVGTGDTAAIAVMIADVFEKLPQLKQMVQDAEQLNNGKMPDDLVKQLFDALGGGSND